MRLPSLAVPPFPQIGQPFACADREDQVSTIYSVVVDAGNALIQGQRPVPRRLVVTGYKGVGKSSVVLQVLGMLRDPQGIAPGQQVAYGALPDPVEPQRWLVLRVSGKHVRGIEGLPDDLHRSVIAILEDAARDAELTTPDVLREAIPGVLRLPFFHRLFRSREAELFEKVRTALVAFSLTVDFVRAYRGAKLNEKVEESRRSERTAEIKTFLEGQLKARGMKAESAEAQAAVTLSHSFIAKWSHALESKRSMEHEVTVNADLATEALNAFFAATAAAKLPTVFVLDDFDELASGAGTAHTARAKVLMEVLGVFNQLAPTCLVLAVRQEYLHEDLIRQFRQIYLPPMTRAAAGDMLDKWVGTQTVQWSDEMRAELRAVGEKFVGGFPQDTPVVLPDRFLPLVTWAARSAREGETPKAALMRHLRLGFDSETVRAVERLAMALKPEDVQACAEAVPIDPEPYEIRSNDRMAMEKSGLLRPAMAWSDGDKRIILDPLVAYLRAVSG